jgi:hypothetical protein
MLRHLVTSALVLGSAVAVIAPSVSAQNVTVPFRGNIPANCTFGTATPGTISVGRLDPSGAVSALTGFDGAVNISCLAPGNLTISAPVKVSGPSFTPTACRATYGTVGIPTVEFNSCDGTSPALPVSGSRALRVGLFITAGAIPPGDYEYNVILSIVP